MKTLKVLSYILLLITVLIIWEGFFSADGILDDLNAYERYLLNHGLENASVSDHLQALETLQVTGSFLILSVMVFPLIGFVVALTTSKKFFGGFISGFFLMIPFLLGLLALTKANFLISVWSAYTTVPGNYYEELIHNKTFGWYTLLLFIPMAIQFADAIIKTIRHKNGKDVPVETKQNDAETLANKLIENLQPQNTDAAQIKQYKELLDMGAITQEEFDAKKKQLLGLPTTYGAPAAPQNIGKCVLCGHENVSVESIEVVVAGMSRKRTMCAECAAKYK